MKDGWRQSLAELVGTFYLCFIGIGAIVTDQYLRTENPAQPRLGLVGIALAHGLALSIAVSATMNISGAHLNPAVTITMLACRRIGVGKAVCYIIAQCVGAVLGAALVKTFFTFNAGIWQEAHLGLPMVTKELASEAMGWRTAVAIEAALTFLLVFSIFGTAVDPRAPKIGGFGIGLTVAFDILVGGPLTGAAMNPARTLGPALVGYLFTRDMSYWSMHGVYWAGPIAGGLIAGLIYHHVILPRE